MFIIQDKVFGEETNLLVEALIKNNVNYKLIKNDYEINNHDNDNKYFVRGSIEFVESLNSPFLTLNNYTYSTYSQWSALMFNSNFIILPWWTLKKSAVGIFNAFPEAEKFFIRPNSGRKIFTGTTLTKKWWSKELDIIKSLPNSNILDEDLVIISSCKSIQNEYRVLMYKKEIIDWCIYEGNNNKTFADYFFIDSLIKSIDFYPDLIYTIDIVRSENQYKILEINSAVSAGWYDMDYDKIVKRMKNENLF